MLFTTDLNILIEAKMLWLMKIGGDVHKMEREYATLDCTCGNSRLVVAFGAVYGKIVCLSCGLAGPRRVEDADAVKAWNKMIESRKRDAYADTTCQQCRHQRNMETCE